jgi:hypothetical protein
MLTSEEAAALAEMAQEDARQLFRDITWLNDMFGRYLVFDRANELMGGKGAFDALLRGKGRLDA